MVTALRIYVAEAVRWTALAARVMLKLMHRLADTASLKEACELHVNLTSALHPGGQLVSPAVSRCRVGCHAKTVDRDPDDERRKYLMDNV
jgi:hypothetical protein